MTRQRILVLGCNDALGRAIADALATSAWARPVVLSSEYAPRHANIDVSSEALPTLYGAADAIIAAFSGNASDIRQQASKLFVNTESAWRQKRIVLLSSMTVYGDIHGEVDERSATGTQLSDYAAARVESERLAAGYSNVVTLRLGVEYGPGCAAWSERVAHWLTQRRIGDLGALGDGYCNLVYIDDVVAAVIASLRLHPQASQTFNLAAPSPPTWNDYFIRFAKSLGAVPVRRMTRRRVKIETKLLAPPLKMIELVARRMGITTAPAIPPSAIATFGQEIRLDSSTASAVLNVSWTPLEEGLKRTAAWFSNARTVKSHHS